MVYDAIIESAARSIDGLAPALTSRPEQELVDISRGIARGHFTPDRHFAFEGVAWYWHFVDVVWLGLFFFVYWL